MKARPERAPRRESSSARFPSGEELIVSQNFRDSEPSAGHARRRTRVETAFVPTQGVPEESRGSALFVRAVVRRERVAPEGGDGDVLDGGLREGDQRIVDPRRIRHRVERQEQTDVERT